MQRRQYPDVPPDFGHWLAGFIDGEGCFVINHKHHTGYGTTYSCAMTVGLRDDDADILAEIKKTTGCGGLSFRPRRRTGRDFDTKPGAHWFVSDRRDCARMVQVLTEFPLRAKKARDFAIWAEAMRVWAQVYRGAAARNGINTARWRRMAELKKMLSEGRAYHGSLVVPEPVQLHAVSASENLGLF